MIPKILLAALLVSLAPAPAPAYTNAELKKMYLQSLNEKDPETRRKLQTRIANAAPDSAYGLMCDAAALIAEGKMEPLLAIKLYSKAAKLDPSLAKAHNNLGLAYSELNRCGRAIEDFTRAIQADPGYANAYANRGYCRNRLGDQEKALQDFQKSLSLKPDDHLTLLNRGLLYHEAGKYGKAAADFSEVIRLKPDYADAYAYRCEARKALGEAKKAAADCALAEKLRGGAR